MSRERFKIKDLMAMFLESFEQLGFTATCRSGKNNQLNLLETIYLIWYLSLE